MKELAPTQKGSRPFESLPQKLFIPLTKTRKPNQTIYAADILGSNIFISSVGLKPFPLFTGLRSPTRLPLPRALTSVVVLIIAC
mmetsp:Transcript_12678/g.18971  ORF Transcript_12678/g.18971 Transcript_12678/m.18971 type:complete len:84 (-) Transcript_12678:2082-2333(-)